MRYVSLYSTTALAVLLFFCGTALAQPAAPLFDVLSTPPALSAAQRSARQQIDSRATSRAVQFIRFRDLSELPKRTFASVAPAAGKAPVVLRATRFQARADGFTWAARNEADGSSAFFSVTDGSVYGTIHTSGKTYAMEPLGAGLHALVEVATEAFGPDEPADFEQRAEEEAASHPTVHESSENSRSGAPSSFSMNGGNGAPVIDVLVVYTAAAAATTSNINGLIQGAVDATNVANGNSLVAEQINVVGKVQISYTETGYAQTTVDRLAGANDGYMDNVHSLRNTYHADVVVLMVANLVDAVGIVKQIGALDGTAFAVVRTDAAISNYTFAHEVGHLMGARHDTDPGGSPYNNTHGYRYAPGYWRTIMAIPQQQQGQSDPVGRIQYWSNPYVSLGGVPMGTANYYYDASAWASRGTTVAGFRTPPPPPDPLAVTISGPGGLGYKESATYSASVTGGTGSISYAWYRRSPGGSYYYTGCSGQTCSQMMVSSDFELKVDVTRGSESASDTKYVNYGLAKAGHPAETMPDAYVLSAPQPNPARGTTSISFSLPEAAHVRLVVYDGLGREVARLVDTQTSAGTHTARFEGQNLPAGLYLYRIEATGGAKGTFTDSGRIVLIQ